MHKSTQFIAACIAFTVGVGMASSAISFGDLLIPFIAGTGFAAAVLWNTMFRIVLLCILTLSLGMLRVEFLPSFNENPYEEQIEIIGTIVREPQIEYEKQQIIVESAQLDGFLLVGVNLQPQYRVGDVLRIECTLRKPEPFETFAYDKWLQRYGIGSTCYYPTIVNEGHISSAWSLLFDAKRWLVMRLQHTMPSPENTIILGSVFGLNSALPEHLEEAFRRTGTIHLLVISGSNVVIITAVLMGMMKHIPISRRNAIIVVLVMLFVYATFTGWQPPAVRATFFGSIALMASLLGRTSQALRLLILVATLMIVLNPLLLFYDAGFQLSFLATAGIILFSTRLEKHMLFIPKTLGLRTATAVTIAATLTTAPLIAYSFGSFSVISLPANLIMGSMMEFIMLAGCLAIILAAVFPTSIATWLVLPLYYVIHFSLELVQWLNIPYASVEGITLPLWGMMAMYMVIGYVALRK